MNREHYTDLDGVRGLLACVVMLYHFGLNSILATATRGLLVDGHWGLAVDFFFILSGFVLCASFKRRPIGVAEYIGRRFRRPAPMHYLTLAAMLIIGTHDFSLWDVLCNILMIHSLVGAAPVNNPAWSVAPEMYVPLAALLGLPLLERRNLPTLLALLAGLLVFGGVLCLMLVQGRDEPAIRGIFGILTGFVLFQIHSVVGNQPARPMLFLLVVLLLLGVMAVTGVVPALSILFYPLSCAAVLLGVNTRTLLSSLPFQLLGLWSYGIYLLHIPVLVAAQRLLGQDGVDGNIIAKLGMVLTTVGLAALLYRFVEKPLMSRKRAASVSA